MSTAARMRLARTLRGDEQTAFSAELTAPADALKLDVEGFGPTALPIITPPVSRGQALFPAPADRLTTFP